MAIPISHHGERIDLRVPEEIKSLLARAASYSGLSLTSFLVLTATERARALVAEQEKIELSGRDWEVFLAALDAPDRPRPRLEAAARRHLARRRPRDAR